MKTVNLTTRVGSDGVLRLEVPVDVMNTELEVVLVLQPMASAPTNTPEARGWPQGYFEEVIGSLPDFPDVDGDMGGIDPSLDETEDELRFHPPEEPAGGNQA
jgi:hypothetical protein